MRTAFKMHRLERHVTNANLSMMMRQSRLHGAAVPSYPCDASLVVSHLLEVLNDSHVCVHEAADAVLYARFLVFVELSIANGSGHAL